MPPTLTTAELLALPASVELTIAGRAFGLGRRKTYELARRGEFPCRVISIGHRYRVPRSALLEALGIDPGLPQADHEPTPTA